MLALLETLARADASVAWTVMIGGSAWMRPRRRCPAPSFDAVFDRPRRHRRRASSTRPARSRRPTAGTGCHGRWAFASGCEHADVALRQLRRGRSSTACRSCAIALLSAGRGRRSRTPGPSSGLCGTGSHHFRVDDVVVPADRTLSPFADEPCLDEPIVRHPAAGAVPAAIAAVAVGIAQGALDDILALAATKVPLLAAAPLAANPLFQLDLADGGHRPARGTGAALRRPRTSCGQARVAGQPPPLELRARARATRIWVTDRAAAVVTAALPRRRRHRRLRRLPLHRRLRDVHTLTQHFLVKRATLTTAGAVLAGRDIAVPVF